MSLGTTFNEVLEAVEDLPDDQQADLVELVRRRLAERGRRQIIADAAAARQEYAEGKARAMSVDDIMREIGQ